MSAVSTQPRHVSAASLVITTSHRETRVFAFICRTLLLLLLLHCAGCRNNSRAPPRKEMCKLGERGLLGSVVSACACPSLSLTHMHTRFPPVYDYVPIRITIPCYLTSTGPGNYFLVFVIVYLIYQPSGEGRERIEFSWTLF